MAINYAKFFNRRVTPQSRPIPGSNQVRNSGGGYSWAVDDWTVIDIFIWIEGGIVNLMNGLDLVIKTIRIELTS